jgi:hypothetical protein
VTLLGQVVIAVLLWIVVLTSLFFGLKLEAAAWALPAGVVSFQAYKLKKDIDRDQ